jgi:hypothetical protein
MTTIQIDDRELRVLIGRAKAALKSRALLAVLGREGRNALREHYLLLDRTKPNQLRGKRTHFWRAVARSVQNPVPDGADAVRIGIAHPHIRQKVEGGTIVAKRAGALTIPVSAEAHGRTAETLEKELGVTLFRVPSDFGEGLLAAAMADGRIKVHYVLRRSVEQAPDPDALPKKGPLVARLISRARAWLARVL